MPWNISDVERHKKGLTPAQQQKWVSIANSILADGGDEAKAIRIANTKAIEAEPNTVYGVRAAMNAEKRLREAGSDDHPYGPWVGGSKASGGRPGGGGASGEKPKGDGNIGGTSFDPESMSLDDLEEMLPGARYHRDIMLGSERLKASGQTYAENIGSAQARLLDNGRTVNAQPGEVAHIVTAASKTTGDPDLANLKVDGKAVFAGGTVPRAQMPQVTSTVRDQYTADLRARGITVKSERVDPSSLAPMQSQISGRKTGDMIPALRENSRGIADKPILISQDGKVLDGHHRWSAAVVIGYDKPGTTIPVIRVGMNGDKAIGHMDDWATSQGIAKKSLSESDWEDW